MKSAHAGWLLVFLLVLMGIFSAGCGPAPPCETSLVRLDEMRLELDNYEEELAKTRAELKELEEKLSEKKEQIEEVDEEPGKLEKKVRELKKGSGRL